MTNAIAKTAIVKHNKTATVHATVIALVIAIRKNQQAVAKIKRTS